MASNTPRRLRLLSFLPFFSTLAWALPAAAEPPAVPTDTQAPPAAPPSHARPAHALSQHGSVLDELSGSLVVGPGWFDPGDLEARLREHGFGDVKTQVVFLGLSGRIIFDNSVALGGAGAIVGRPHVEGSGEYDATLGYNTLRAEGGYAFLHSDTWLLLPKLALGVYSATLGLNDDREVTFDEVLEESGTTTNLSSRGFLMGALLDFEYRFAPGRTDGAVRGYFGVGVEGGFFYSVPLSSWRLESGTAVDDGPDAPLTGGFVGVTLGGGVIDL